MRTCCPNPGHAYIRGRLTATATVAAVSVVTSATAQAIIQAVDHAENGGSKTVGGTGENVVSVAATAAVIALHIIAAGIILTAAPGTGIAVIVSSTAAAGRIRLIAHNR